MNAVLIGASDRSSLWRHGTLDEQDYDRFVSEYAHFLKDHFENVIITPDDGVYTDIADAFSDLTGRKAIAFYPDADTKYGIQHIEHNLRKYDSRPIGGDWYTLNADLTAKAPVVLVFGFTPGVLIELAYVKYHQKYGANINPALKDVSVLIDERCIEGRLPSAVEEQIKNMHYYKEMEGLRALLENVYDTGQFPLK